MERRSRALVYALVGLGTELAFTAATRGRPRTSLWMLPVYALVQPLFEPAHERLRPRPRRVRAAAYGLGFAAVEYASGRAFRRLRGQAPWDYSHAKLHFHGLVRADYVPLWGAYGLALEPLHDRLIGARRAPTRAVPSTWRKPWSVKQCKRRRRRRTGT